MYKRQGLYGSPKLFSPGSPRESSNARVVATVVVVKRAVVDVTSEDVVQAARAIIAPNSRAALGPRGLSDLLTRILSPPLECPPSHETVRLLGLVGPLLDAVFRQ